MDILSIMPVVFKPMSIISLLLIIAIILIIKYIKEEHKILKIDFEKTRGKIYDRIDEMKDNFGDVKLTVARTEQMIKSNADIQKIIQKDISEIRKRLNK